MSFPYCEHGYCRSFWVSPTYACCHKYSERHVCIDPRLKIVPNKHTVQLLVLVERSPAVSRNSSAVFLNLKLMHSRPCVSSREQWVWEWVPQTGEGSQTVQYWGMHLRAVIFSLFVTFVDDNKQNISSFILWVKPHYLFSLSCCHCMHYHPPTITQLEELQVADWV